MSVLPEYNNYFIQIFEGNFTSLVLLPSNFYDPPILTVEKFVNEIYTQASSKPTGYTQIGIKPRLKLTINNPDIETLRLFFPQCRGVEDVDQFTALTLGDYFPDNSIIMKKVQLGVYPAPPEFHYGLDMYHQGNQMYMRRDGGVSNEDIAKWRDKCYRLEQVKVISISPYQYEFGITSQLHLEVELEGETLVTQDSSRIIQEFDTVHILLSSSQASLTGDEDERGFGKFAPNSGGWDSELAWRINTHVLGLDALIHYDYSAFNPPSSGIRYGAIKGWVWADQDDMINDFWRSMAKDWRYDIERMPLKFCYHIYLEEARGVYYPGVFSGVPDGNFDINVILPKFFTDLKLFENFEKNNLEEVDIIFQAGKFPQDSGNLPEEDEQDLQNFFRKYQKWEDRTKENNYFYFDKYNCFIYYPENDAEANSTGTVEYGMDFISLKRFNNKELNGDYVVGLGGTPPDYNEL